MLEAKIFGLLIIMRSVFCGCAVEPKSTGFSKNKRTYKISAVTRLPKGFTESSGLITSSHEGEFYTHTDSGGQNHLYRINLEGDVLDTVEIVGVQNKDWEDITKDDAGNYYIGDFGNNLNQRKDLKIFKISPDFRKIETINFAFEDQKEFPPSKKEKNFDMEGFFWKHGSLHLFSKNWGAKCLNYYSLSDQPGSYSISPVQSLYVNGMITAADISPDGKLVALLSYGKVYLFEVGPNDGYLSHPLRCIPFVKGAQSEGLVFVNDTDFLISNETGRLFIGRKRKKDEPVKY